MASCHLLNSSPKGASSVAPASWSAALQRRFSARETFHPRPQFFNCLLLLSLLLSFAIHAADHRGAQFISFSEFSKFSRAESAFISPVISPSIPWDELIVSWNVRGESRIEVEARLIFPEATTPYYQLGVWSFTERHSITNQADEFATIATDTLMAKRPGAKAQIRLKLTGGTPADLKFLALSFADTKAKPTPLPPNRKAWGKTIDVPIRSQTDYPQGLKWCSPTGCSMILEYWSRQLNQPELNLTVPEMASRALDSTRAGVGNWPFNTAVGGHFHGMRSYVARLTDLSELEDWIQAGIPIAANVSYSRLKGENKSGEGHLVVCVGFNKWGDVVINDPGAQKERVRRTITRERFRTAWAESNNTVYLTYPEAAKIPETTLGHWE